ncbi:MAG TPA: 5'/3'-nucleotidase SurE [Dehalococcoidia bacterium]|nr:5'/3'-nucleotidase SurE [Dehalococcoidia bacterium]
MRILATNDDGIYAPGLWKLVEVLSPLGEVWVVAPDREQSGVGTSLTLHDPLRLQPIAPPIPGIPTFAVEGTPGDCVVLGLGQVVKGEVDLVVAGVNQGANLGNDVYVSGTVGAAFHGYFYDLPAMAVSVVSFRDVIYEPAARLARLLAQRIGQGVLPHGELLLNINLPNLPLKELKGIEVTGLARRAYSDIIKEGHDGKRDYYWIVRGRAEWDDQPGTDIKAIKDDKISITPLRAGPGADLVAGVLKELSPELFEALLTAA